MRKVIKTVLMVLLILIVLLGALTMWQWNNIKALFMSINYSTEEIDALSKENEKKISTVLKEITEADTPKIEEENTSEEKKADKRKIDDIIAKIYKLREEYVSELSMLEKEARATIKSVPKKERTATKKLELIELYTGKAAKLEKQCDAKMESLISQIKAELNGRSDNARLISEIRSLYSSEKELKKSQLLNKYKKYLQ